MNVALWIAQGFAALVFVLTGGRKAIAPKHTLTRTMHWAAMWPARRIKLLGLAEVAGALGLILPGILHVAPALTSVAALCLAALMVGAVQTHRRLHESVVPPAVLLLLCLVVAAGRLPPAV